MATLVQLLSFWADPTFKSFWKFSKTKLGPFWTFWYWMSTGWFLRISQSIGVKMWKQQRRRCIIQSAVPVMCCKYMLLCGSILNKSELGTSLLDPGRPGGPGPLSPNFFKIMQFSRNCKGKTAILSKFWAPPPPRGQNSIGSPWPKSCRLILEWICAWCLLVSQVLWVHKYIWIDEHFNKNNFRQNGKVMALWRDSTCTDRI